LKYALMAALLLSFNVFADEPEHDYSLGSAPEKRCLIGQIVDPAKSCGWFTLTTSYMPKIAAEKMGWEPGDNVQGTLINGKTYMMLLDVVDVEACQNVTHYAWFGEPQNVPENSHDNNTEIEWHSNMFERECNHSHAPCGRFGWPSN